MFRCGDYVLVVVVVVLGDEEEWVIRKLGGIRAFCFEVWIAARERGSNVSFMEHAFEVPSLCRVEKLIIYFQTVCRSLES